MWQLREESHCPYVQATAVLNANRHFFKGHQGCLVNIIHCSNRGRIGPVKPRVKRRGIQAEKNKTFSVPVYIYLCKWRLLLPQGGQLKVLWASETSPPCPERQRRGCYLWGFQQTRGCRSETAASARRQRQNQSQSWKPPRVSCNGLDTYLKTVLDCKVVSNYWPFHEFAFEGFFCGNTWSM